METTRRRLTKQPARMWNARLHRPDLELIFRAAALEGISQADFVRLSIRERAQRILRDPERAA